MCNALAARAGHVLWEVVEGARFAFRRGVASEPWERLVAKKRNL